MLNSFHEYESFLLKSNSYKQVTQYRCPVASLIRAQVQKCCVSCRRRLYLVETVTGPSTVLESAGSEEHRAAALLQMRTNRLGTRGEQQSWRDAPSLFPISGPSRRHSDGHRVFQHHLVSSLLGFSDGSCSTRLWSGPRWLTLVDFTYKSAAECESETRSKRMQPPCGLQSNAGKSLFWRDSHLWKAENSIYPKCIVSLQRINPHCRNTTMWTPGKRNPGEVNQVTRPPLQRPEIWGEA